MPLSNAQLKPFLLRVPLQMNTYETGKTVKKVPVKLRAMIVLQFFHDSTVTEGSVCRFGTQYS